MVQVYRVEHVGCSKGTGPIKTSHGPATGRSYMCPDECPWYGNNGPVPQCDKPPTEIQTWHLVGVTIDQAPGWWDDEPSPCMLETWHDAGWRLVEYEVEEWGIEILKWQCVFNPRQAERVAEHPLTMIVPERTRAHANV